MGARLIDVGTDHGWLPILLTERDIVQSAIAADINQGPLNAARTNIRNRSLQDRIETRLGPGLTVVQPGEVDTAVIAGMGGPLIVDILQGAPLVLNKLDHLILQPMIAVGRVRQFLDATGFCITHETVLEDMERAYVLLRADRINGIDPYASYRHNADALQAAYDYGPMLLAHPSPEFVHYIWTSLERLQHAHTQLTRATSHHALDKEQQMQARIEWLQTWLSRAQFEPWL
jgi:tRNA (adenine22-N1)-methyltransferase